MAYGYGSRRRRRTTRRMSTRYSRRPRRRTRRTRRAASQRIVIQVVGGPGGHVPVGVTSGTKGKRTIRSRF